MKFNESGFLDPGIHTMTWEEFFIEFSFSPKRKVLLEGLKKVVDILKATGCSNVYIDGSFISSRLEPNDWDACFECAPTVIREVYKEFPLLDIKEQKKTYGGELYPASTEADAYRTPYLEFFQQITGTPFKKGIIRIQLN